MRGNMNDQKDFTRWIKKGGADLGEWENDDEYVTSISVKMHKRKPAYAIARQEYGSLVHLTILWNGNRYGSVKKLLADKPSCKPEKYREPTAQEAAFISGMRAGGLG
jgi:hypothetical protein